MRLLLVLLALCCAAASPTRADEGVAPAPLERPPGALDSVLLVDGEVVRGVVLAADASAVLVRLSSGTELIIPRDQVRLINRWSPPRPVPPPPPPGIPEQRTVTDGSMIELRSVVGTGAILNDASGNSKSFVGAGIAGGYRYGYIEGGIEGGTGSVTCNLCATPSATIYSVDGFAGGIYPLSPLVSAELRAKFGGHFFGNVNTGQGATQPQTAALPFLGFEPRLSVRLGGERLALLFALAFFADFDIGPVTLVQPTAPAPTTQTRGSGGSLTGATPVSGTPVTVGGPNFGGALSVGFSFR